MSFKRFYPTNLVIVLSLMITACGGGSSDSSSTAPTAQISSASVLPEGTTFIDINAGNSSDSNGVIDSYLWSIEDNDGISSLSITDITENSTQITGIPAVISQDIIISIGLIVTDNDGESSNKVTKTITIDNNTATVDVSNFDGTWFSPCFNNRFGFSVRQTLNISGNSMTSDITSYTSGTTTPARNCITPSSGQTIFSDATATLNYALDVSNASCLNGMGVNTDVDIASVSSSGTTHTSQSEISDALALVTGYSGLLPDSTTMCITPSGNLLFAGSIYTAAASNSNVDVIEANIDADVSWQVGNNVYFGGQDASASTSSMTTNNSFGVVVVGTNLDTSNGDFSGSSVSITHSLSGSGLYTVTDNIGINSDNQVSITVVVGTANINATSYESVNSINSIEVIEDSEGRYHFTLSSPIFLEKGVEVGTGVPGAPATFDFTMDNIYDYSD